MIDLLEIMPLTVEPATIGFGLDDPDDEVYLATASAGEAQALITGDLRHFPERLDRGIEILTPIEFLERY